MSDNTLTRLFDVIDNNLEKPMPKSGGTFTGNISAPTPSTNDDSTKVATTEYVQNNLDNYVDLTSSQDISGDKTFHHTIKINADSGYNTGLAFTNISSERPQRMISGYAGDMTSVVSSLYFNKNFTTELNRIGLRAQNGVNYADIYIGIDSSGNITTYAPTPATSDNSTNIATTAYVKSNLNSYLPLSGGTLTGNIYGSPAYNNSSDPDWNADDYKVMFISKDPVYIKGDTLTDNRWFTLAMATDADDSIENNHKFGQIETAVATSGACYTGMYAFKNETSSTANVGIAVGYDANGVAYSTAVTPANKYDSSNQIATTSFCATQYNSTYVPDNIIGIEYVASPTDGRGKWRRINKYSQVVDPLPSYFNNHPTYGAINYTYTDDCSMINIPKFYFLYQQTSTGHKWWISNASFTISGVGTSIVHPGFVYSGTEKSQFYVGAYECSAQTKNSTNMARSIGSGTSNVTYL